MMYPCTRLLLGGVVIAYLLTSVVSHPYMGGFPSRSYLEYAINLNERCEAEAAEHDGRGRATLFAHSVPVHTWPPPRSPFIAHAVPPLKPLAVTPAVILLIHERCLC